MKKLFALAAFALCCISCLNSKDPTPQPVTCISGVYVLNNGKWTYNNSNFGTYDYDTKSLSPNLFETVNGKKLGDLGQDILVYGNKMYIAVSGSGIVFVTDLSGKILGEVKAGEQGNWQPRYLTSYEGNVFISYYEGYVGKIDTINFALSLSEKIGNNPEGLAVSGKKLYVAISNGLNYPDFDSTVVVLDPSNLVVKKELTVGLNPGKMVSCGDYIFCICCGNYNNVKDSLSVIYTPSGDYEDNVSTLRVNGNPVNIASDNTRYVFVAAKEETNYNILSVDCYAGSVYDTKFIKDETMISNYVYSLDVDPINYALFVGTTDYVNNGDMYVFNQYGMLYDKFDTQGINPIRTAFSTTTVYR